VGYSHSEASRGWKETPRGVKIGKRVERRKETADFTIFLFLFFYLVHFEFFFRPSHSVRRSVARFADCPASTSVAAVDTNKRQFDTEWREKKRERPTTQ
jgi:hypothetical protein